MGQTPNVVALQDHVRARTRGGDGASASLDLVARLFDSIVPDEGIAPVARAELARLRIPTLRAIDPAPLVDRTLTVLLAGLAP